MVVSVKTIQLIQWTIWSGVMVKFQIQNTPSQTQNTSSQIPNAPSKIQRNYDAFFFRWNCWYIFMKAAVSSFPRVGAPGQSKILLNSDPFPFGREPSGWLPSPIWLPSGGWLALGGMQSFWGEAFTWMHNSTLNPTVPLRFKDTSPEPNPSDTDPLSLKVKWKWKFKSKIKWNGCNIIVKVKWKWKWDAGSS